MNQKGKEAVGVMRIAEAANQKEEFFPRGAITFFVTMIAGFGLIWLGMYWMLVHRNLWL